MNRNRWVVAALAVALVVPLVALGAELRTGNAPGVNLQEQIGDDLYIVGGSVGSYGPIQGDLYAGGGQITIGSQVAQDLVVGGGNVTITGAVGDDLRVGGGTVTIAGQVGDDVVVGGGQVTVSGQQVGGDVLGAAGTLRIDSPVLGSVRIAGGDIYLNAPVAGNVEVRADKLTLGPAAAISGNLTYKSPNEAVREQGSTVLGTVNYTPVDKEMGKQGRALFAAFISVFAIFALLSRLAGAFFFAFFLRRWTSEVVHVARVNPLLEAGRGFLALVALPVASILLMITGIGLPLGGLGLLAWFSLMIVTALIAPVILGTVIFGKRGGEWPNPTWQNVLVGVLVYWVLGWIPIVGWVVRLAFVLMAAGAVTNWLWRHGKNWR